MNETVLCNEERALKKCQQFSGFSVLSSLRFLHHKILDRKDLQLNHQTDCIYILLNQTQAPGKDEQPPKEHTHQTRPQKGCHFSTILIVLLYY